MADGLRRSSIIENIVGIVKNTDTAATVPAAGIIVYYSSQASDSSDTRDSLHIKNISGYHYGDTYNYYNSGISAKGCTINNSQGFSRYGIGILAKNTNLFGCYANTSSQYDSTFDIANYSLQGTCNLVNCSSSVNGSNRIIGIEVKPWEGYIETFGATSCNITINDCVIKSPTAGIIFGSSNSAELNVINSTIEISNSDSPGKCIAVTGTSDASCNIQNCNLISGGTALYLGYDSTVDNNTITMSSSNFSWLVGVASGGNALISYSNNSIRGCTSTNGGVTNVVQAIPKSRDSNSVENIIYNQRIYDGLITYYDFGLTGSYPGSGTVVNDISKPALIGGTSYGLSYSTNNGGTMFFDGTNDRILGTPSSTLVLTTEITIEAFVNAVNFTEFPHLSPFRNNPFILNHNSNQGYRLNFNTAGNLEFIANNVAINYNSSGNFAASEGYWYHVAATHGPTGGNLYVNGEIVGTNNVPFVAYNSVQDNLRIGEFTGGQFRFEGFMGLVRLYNKKLTQKQIRQNFYADKARFSL